MDLFKFEFSKIMHPISKSFIGNVIVYQISRLYFHRGLLIREFIAYYIIFELLNNFSFRNLKNWISLPINPLCKNEYYIISDILSNDFNIDRNQQFLNNHFLQNIYFILQDCLHNKLLRLGNKNHSNVSKQDGFLSNENLDNLRNFFEFIVRNFKKENDNIQNMINMKQKGPDIYKNRSLNIKDLKSEVFKFILYLI